MLIWAPREMPPGYLRASTLWHNRKLAHIHEGDTKGTVALDSEMQKQATVRSNSGEI